MIMDEYRLAYLSGKAKVYSTFVAIAKLETCLVKRINEEIRLCGLAIQGIGDDDDNEYGSVAAEINGRIAAWQDIKQILTMGGKDDERAGDDRRA